MSRGQAIVEMAIMLPVAMFIALGFTEVGFLVISKAQQDRTTAVVAEYAAQHDNDSWHALAAHELPGCDVSLSETTKDVVVVTATCQYQPHVIPGWGGLPMTSRELAERPSVPASPSPSEAASPSS